MGEINVSFQIDTDNRENFPSAVAFQTFKKQRDCFYEILKIWEENHTVPGWIFKIALRGKIRTMLTLHNDATNYYHIARLFKSQLLISCIQSGQQEDPIEDESFNFLKALTHVNPEKLTQLRKRLVTPLPSNNHATAPSFPGVQEFFKDFILHAFNSIFYTHLENCLVHEIMELNDTQFTNSEIEDSETMVDEQTRQNFISCLSSLRLLAKVLGLLVSLPYRTESECCEEIIATQVEIRSKVFPSINLQTCLQNALMQGKLSLTVPWIAKYLAMMDVVSLRLPYYKQTLELLYYMYAAVNQCDFSSPDSPISERTALLLKSTLNWLFDLPHFPKDCYLTWQKNCEVKELKNLKQLSKQCVKRSNIMSVETVIPVAPTKFSLDKLDIINNRTLRTCCPPSADFKIPVTTGNTKMNNPNKHITPVSSQLKSSGGVTTKYLELQLEEAFFHGQPASTRKTVDFVSERVASTCVKHICNTLLASSRETNLNSFRNIVKEKQNARQSEGTEESLSNADFKSSLVNEMNTLAISVSKGLKEQCEKTIPTICEARVAKSIESLLAEDSLSPVKEMCIKIATRMATERINQWIQSHIVGGSLFISDMEVEMNRFLKNNTPVNSAQEKRHNPNVASPTNVIDEIRSLIWDILDNRGKSLTTTVVSAALDKMYHTLTERSDLLSGPEKILYSLSIDFALFLVAHRADLFIRDVQDAFIKVWRLSHLKVLEPDSPMLRLLSPRNIMLLAQPEDDEVWPVLGKFLRKLLDKDILDIDALSDQCVALFRHEWPMPILKHLSKCLTETIADYKASDEATEKVKYLLGWVAETYHDIEICDDYGSLE